MTFRLSAVAIAFALCVVLSSAHPIFSEVVTFLRAHDSHALQIQLAPEKVDRSSAAVAIGGKLIVDGADLGFRGNIEFTFSPEATLLKKYEEKTDKEGTAEFVGKDHSARIIFKEYGPNLLAFIQLDYRGQEILISLPQIPEVVWNVLNGDDKMKEHWKIKDAQPRKCQISDKVENKRLNTREISVNLHFMDLLVKRHFY
eukprot:c603_g1_i1.p1 GENE.c603_g1_i1~~c603_g1_i1.p1  ORF type:complete len:200 (+),score=50.54 c603_g1_i1:71-670(+)